MPRKKKDQPEPIAFQVEADINHKGPYNHGYEQWDEQQIYRTRAEAVREATHWKGATGRIRPLFAGEPEDV